jgi:hypothetical protein
VITYGITNYWVRFDVTASPLTCSNLFTRAPSWVLIKTGNYQLSTASGVIPAGRFFFRRERDTEMAIYLVELESDDGQTTSSFMSVGKTRRECIQNAVDLMSARDGVVYRATATTNYKTFVEAPILPPLPTPRRIYVSPKPRGQCQRCGKTLNGPEPTTSSLTNTPDGTDRR